MSQLTREEEKRRLTEKAKLLWRLVTSTPGVADLAEPMRRVERNFAHLSSGQRTTVAIIAKLFEDGCHGINEVQKETPVQPESSPVQSETPQAIQPDEVIPPGKD
jgi:hypothetical protein